MFADLKTSEIKGNVDMVNGVESWSTWSHLAHSALSSIRTSTMHRYLPCPLAIT